MRLEPTPTEHPVQGQLLKFYPISLRMLFRVKGVAKPIMQSLATLFSDPRGDTGSRMMRQTGTEVHEINAIDPALASQRHEQKQKAIDTLVETLFDDAQGRCLALLLLDSMRDEFPDFKGTDTEARDFLGQRNLTVDAATEMIVGVVKANRGVLDPLGIPRLMELISLRFGLSSPMPSDASGPSENVTILQRTEETGETEETPGSDSET